MNVKDILIALFLVSTLSLGLLYNQIENNGDQPQNRIDKRDIKPPVAG